MENLPPGWKPIDVPVIDEEIRQDFSTYLLIVYLFRITFVYRIKGNSSRLAKINRLLKLASASVGPENQLMTFLLKRLQGFKSKQNRFSYFRVLVFYQSTVEIYSYGQ